MGSLDAFHTFMEDMGLLELDDDFFDLYDFDMDLQEIDQLLPTIEELSLEDLDDPADFNTELLNYDDDWSIFW